MKKSTLNRILSMVLAIVMSMSLCIPAFASDEDACNSPGQSVETGAFCNRYIIDKETRNADIQRQLNIYIDSLNKKGGLLRSDYNYIYSTEQLPAGYAKSWGFAGNQPTKGVKFDKPGGSFNWKPEGGPMNNVTLSLSYPFNYVAVGVDLGLSTKGTTGYSQRVNNYTDFVKLWVIKTMEVVPVVTYRTNRYTGDKEVYSKTLLSTMYSVEFEVRVV